ncbi:hypothetical protein [Hydrocarboniclastica marina]|uniref:MSHA biogenesis protein MshN n=1 Tax=Hydrocarboniclastica marina TaxID=2259620 RepID=A0A4P7XFT2_9ALTE|nr:hypothetical protein [Hydrocarboniclastica marina]QCF24992.1 hypothetical protein soil367_03020 [Hydrocarboniclastica marina]
MSLLNDALRDLERRGGQAPDAHGLAQQPFHQPKKSASPGRVLVVGVLLAASLAAAFAGRQDSGWYASAVAPAVTLSGQGSFVPEPAAAMVVTTETELVPVRPAEPGLGGADASQAVVVEEAGLNALPLNAVPLNGAAEQPAQRAAMKAVAVTPEGDSRETVAEASVQHLSIDESGSESAPGRETATTFSVRQQPQSDTARDQRLVISLERLLVEGQEAEAERLLTEALTGGRALPRSHAAMASYYLSQKRLSEARRWLPAPLLEKDPGLRLLRGRLVLMEDGVEAALSFLESELPALAEAPDYHATLASLYQQSGNAIAAGDRWGALLETDSGRADWWLGLALALDSQNQLAAAGVAYAEALALPDLPPRLRTFAESRLEGLR